MYVYRSTHVRLLSLKRLERESYMRENRTHFPIRAYLLHMEWPNAIEEEDQADLFSDP